MNDSHCHLLRDRDAETHKGNYGRVVIVAGSRGMAGAAALCGSSAARAGAGLVTCAVPDRCLDVVAALNPVYMTVPLADDHRGRLTSAANDQIKDVLAPADCVGIGPGLQQTPGVNSVVQSLYNNCEQPAVIDADGLNCLATLNHLSTAKTTRVLTPHPGEFRRLLHGEYSHQDRIQVAQNYAETHGVILVLKGHHSIVTDGCTVYQNRTGNPGMATGGSGDVLTGILTALIAQFPNHLFEAVTLGVRIHGLAGDIAKERHGEISLIATDIYEALPQAFLQLQSRD